MCLLSDMGAGHLKAGPHVSKECLLGRGLELLTAFAVVGGDGVLEGFAESMFLSFTVLQKLWVKLQLHSKAPSFPWPRLGLCLSQKPFLHPFLSPGTILISAPESLQIFPRPPSLISRS